MEAPDDRPIRKGDKGFLFRLIGGTAVVIMLAVLVLGLLERSQLGGCAARGFLQITDSPASD